MTKMHKESIGLSIMLTIVSTAPMKAAAQTACVPTRAAFEATRQRVIAPTPQHVVVVAHRACHSSAPENSERAIEACWRMGVEVIENDVRRTKDGHLVVMHDGEVDRVTNGYGYVGDMTLAELKQLSLREGDGGPAAMVTSSRISTLEEHLIAAKNKVMINFELKPADGHAWKSLYEQSISIARRLGVIDHLLIKVPDTRSHNQRGTNHILDALKVEGDVQLMPIIWQSGLPASSRLDQLEPHRPVGYEVPVTDVSYLASVSADPRMRQRPVMAISLKPYWSGGLDDRLAIRDPSASWGKLIKAGATMIMTDRPEYLLTYLEEVGYRISKPC